MQTSEQTLFNTPIEITYLKRDEVKAAKMLNKEEIRFLVESYYDHQEQRIRLAGRIKAMKEAGQSAQVFEYQLEVQKKLESQAKRQLDVFTQHHPITRWMRSIVGIGPVISAGIYAHIDITKAKYAGAIWRYAGLDPSVTWNKGQKRPWNNDLKKLCIGYLGNCFIKSKGHKDSTYGPLYDQLVKKITEKNEKGGFNGLAYSRYSKFGKETQTYKAMIQGKISKSHIVAMARRKTVQIFLSHLHAVWYKFEFGVDAPAPYANVIMGHSGYIPPYNGFIPKQEEEPDISDLTLGDDE